MRKFPLHIQAEKVKRYISGLMNEYQTNTFDSTDIINPPFRHVVGFQQGIDLLQVLEYLSQMGEIIILSKDDSKVNWDCPLIEFKVTEKFGNIPQVALTIPVTDPIVALFNSELQKMLKAYAIMASVENRLRSLISTHLKNIKGDDWWDTCVPNSVKKNIKEHNLDKWHIQLNKSEIQKTDFSDLIRIIEKNWEDFEPIFEDREMIKAYLRSLEIPRNIIAHSNVLSDETFKDLEYNSSKIFNIIEKTIPQLNLDREKLIIS